jgi:hypothetical protein
MRPVQLWLDEAPERRALLVLLHALNLAAHAVREQHRRLEYHPRDSPPSLPASELLAELVVDRCDELSDWVRRYNRVVDHLIDEQHEHDEAF